MPYIEVLRILVKYIELQGMSKLSKELTAASSTALILSILAKGESYGYEIIQKVKTLSGGEITWTDGMLYPILHKLERKQWIQSEWRMAENDRKRKYYQLTLKGRAQLASEKENWHLITQTLN